MFSKSSSKTSKKDDITQSKKNQASETITIITQHVKTIVLSHNKKRVYEEHNLTDVEAIIKVLTPNNKIIDIKVSAVHCAECNQCIILKTDFKSIKQKETLLCRVIDETSEYIAKPKKSSNYLTESRVHSLEYNVIKQGYNYPFSQRKINLPNYSDAVEKWQQDREFVANYKLGDYPEVVIDEIVVGKRK